MNGGFRLVGFVFVLSRFPLSSESVRCFYCATPGTKIAPQLWLHSGQCTKRRWTKCQDDEQSCVVVRVSHPKANFTVAGCSEDRFEGCDQFIQMAPHGPTALHLCQCRDDKCNSDFHLDFGAEIGRLRNVDRGNSPFDGVGELPLLKKVQPVVKSERDMPCADEQCSQSRNSATRIREFFFLFFFWLFL